MMRIRPGRIAAIATLAVVAAACGTSTEPEVVELDTDAAMQDYETLDAVLSSNELVGFRALGGRTPFGGAPAVAMDAAARMGMLRDRDGSRTYALGLFERLADSRAADGPMAAPIISELHRGATFVYDPEADDYAVDPEREGAPETGVRFITYEVDAAGFPIVEEENGYADLIDEGDGSAEDIVLHLIVVHDGATALDYRTTLDENENRGALTVRGFLSGDGVRLDFDIEAVGTGPEGATTLDVAWDLRVAQRDFSITGSVSGIGEDDEGDDGNGSVDVTVRHRDASIRIDVQNTDGIMDGTIFLNGDIFATVSGPEDEPTILGQGGDPLTMGEMLVLRQIFDTIEDVFDFLEDLLDPVDDLVILGFIL